MIVNFADFDACEIDLYQTEFVDMWTNLHISNHKKCDYWSRPSVSAFHTAINEQTRERANIREPKIINENIDIIYQLTGVQWPIRAYPGMGFNECNLLHRFFTTSLGSGTGYLISEDSRNSMFEFKQTNNPFESYWSDHLRDEKFGIPEVYPHRIRENNPLFVQALENINAAIHRYEDGCLISDRGRDLVKSDMNYIKNLDVDWNNKLISGESIASLDHINTNDTSISSIVQTSYGDDIECDVYHLKNIRGKDYLLAYQQYDDPRHWDITRTGHINGTFTLDPFANTHSIYNSKKFLSWLKEHGHPINSGIYGNLMIGRISNGWKKTFSDTTLGYKSLSFEKCIMQKDLYRAEDRFNITDVEFYT